MVPLPETDSGAWQAALNLAQSIRKRPMSPLERARPKESLWFPDGGLGLFMHWGIHSVKGVQPSWAMIKDYPAGGVPEMHPPERYYAMKKDFHPERYDPDQWMQAAKNAGFTYAVLTAKHHDGYALWPTAFGGLNTRVSMEGRDLLKPYVEACRRHGLRVGFYFSPRDWGYPGYPIGDVDFDYNKRGEFLQIEDLKENLSRFEDFYAYTVAQLHELLTRYGKIDLLWFDGMGWHGIQDLHTEQTMDWIRQLQPGIVMNDRWAGQGDFSTPEWNFPEGAPKGWWENCVSWNGHWGYNPKGVFRPSRWVVDRLVRARAWGGNFLLNVGPAPDGTMPPGFYERCEELAPWIAKHRDALLGAGPWSWENRANVPVTARGDVLYLYVAPDKEGHLMVQHVPMPSRAFHMATGEEVEFLHVEGCLNVNTSLLLKRDPLGDVVCVEWKNNRWEQTIQSFEKRDAEKMPPEEGIVFYGSSSIVGWDVEKAFPGLPVVNRGFGGSTTFDATLFAERVCIRYRPRMVVVYEGDNDIAGGRSASWVLDDTKALVARIHHVLQDTRIILLSIKTSRSRWKLHREMRHANELLKALADEDDRLLFLDMDTPLLDDKGMPRDDLFRKDKLHLNEAGYEIWSDNLRPLLVRE